MAVSGWVSPAGTLAAGGDTETESSTAGNTVMTAVPDSREEGSAAVMVAAPVACPFTFPVADTVAAAVFDDDHVTELVRFWVVPSEYVPVAASWSELPAGTLAAGGDTVTVSSTAGMTVMAAVPKMRPEVAVIVARPVPLAVTTP